MLWPRAEQKQSPVNNPNETMDEKEQLWVRWQKLIEDMRAFKAAKEQCGMPLLGFVMIAWVIESEAKKLGITLPTIQL